MSINSQIRNFYLNSTPIILQTNDLELIPVQNSDLPFYQKIHTDPETLQLYADSEQSLQEKGYEAWKEAQMQLAAARVEKFVSLWTVEKSPFSEFVIWKKEQKIPIGFVTVVSKRDAQGVVETALVISKEEQGKAFGTQVMQVIFRYLPALIETHQQLYQKPILAKGAPFTKVTATARLDNSASLRLLESVGMKKIGIDHHSQWGKPRAIFYLSYEQSSKLFAKL